MTTFKVTHMIGCDLFIDGVKLYSVCLDISCEFDKITVILSNLCNLSQNHGDSM